MYRATLAATHPRRAAPRVSLRRRRAALARAPRARAPQSAGVGDDPGRLASASASSAADLPAVFVGCVTMRDDVLKACAALRVASFYRYDPAARADGALVFGEAAERAQRRWTEGRRRARRRSRMRKMTALGMRVATFAATCRAPNDATLDAERLAAEASAAAESARWDLAREDPPPPVPVPAGAMHCAAASLLARANALSGRAAPREEVVGTLDYHVGARLPGEILEGRLPAAPGDETVEAVAEVDTSVAAVATFAGVLGEDGVASAVDAALALGIDGVIVGDGNVPMDLPLTDPKEGGDGYAGGGALGGRRAYVFNVCVASHRRREGIAARLLRAAHASAADAGVEVMYCHVERDNIPARRLYEGQGYVAEAEESDCLAEKLGRPARVLLRKALAHKPGFGPQ